MKDIIYIKDLRIKTIIGIFDWERKVKQEVSIDMEFPFDCKKAAVNCHYPSAPCISPALAASA